MPLSWNEIKSRAVAFVRKWKNESNEDTEAKSFWDGFFNIFGISRRRVATFEQLVRKLYDKQANIDTLRALLIKRRRVDYSLNNTSYDLNDRER